MRCRLFRPFVAAGLAAVAEAGPVGGSGWAASAGLVEVPARTCEPEQAVTAMANTSGASLFHLTPTHLRSQLIAGSSLHIISGRGHITVTRDRKFTPTLAAFLS